MTEITLNGKMYRAHPSYRNKSHWFDWVLIAWNIQANIQQNDLEKDNLPDYVEVQQQGNNIRQTATKAMLIPAKLICIIQDKSNNIFAIVHSCLQYRKKVSVLTYWWQLEYENVSEARQTNAQYTNGKDTQGLSAVYHKVSIDCVHKHCLIVPYQNSSQFNYGCY